MALLILSGLTSIAKGKPMTPLSLHPDNPHYFLFRNQPTLLLTSAAHYGQVLNLDFDFIPSLDALHHDGLNYTRLFTGNTARTRSRLVSLRMSLRPNLIA